MFIVGLTAMSSVAGAEPDNAYLAELMVRARAATLADEREWHLLLHYRSTWLGGVVSEQDDPGFFLSPHGKTDPQAELEATLRAFFRDDLVGRSKQPAQCAFVARYQWLRGKLAFEDARLPAVRCERFDNWLKEFSAQGISLIFPSAYMNNPASMFGHTFLRVDQRGQTEQTSILAYTINYAADADTDNGLAYAVEGIFGGFKGYYTTIPYYLKVKEYRDIENRDIWEYRLNLTDGQVRRLLLHAWEMGNAYFDYFFFKENCSYHLLSLLEYANPDLHATDQFLFWTIPVDTVRVLDRYPGLVGERVYRPSRVSKIKRRREDLSGEELQWLKTVTEDTSSLRHAEFVKLPPERRAAVLDVASDYLLYRTVADAPNATTYADRNRAVLAARSQLKVRGEDKPVLPFTASPEQGHQTARVGMAGGVRQGDWFEEINFRGAHHDVLDPDPGYAFGSQLQIGALSLRHYHEQNQVRIERLTVWNAMSLSPIDRMFLSPSWKLNVGMDTVRQERAGVSCRYCSNGNINIGGGGAIESHVLRHEMFFAMIEGDANVSAAYEEHHRVGAGGTVGMLAEVTDRWKVMMTSTYLRFPFGERGDEWRGSIQQRYTLTNNLAVRFEFNHRHKDTEGVLSLYAYF